jgi:hypothetical protein
LARALGVTPQQVTVGLSAAQVLPALAGAVLGIPGGFGLFLVVKHGGTMSYPPFWWLISVVLGTLLLVAGLTAIPARIGARRPSPRSFNPKPAERSMDNIWTGWSAGSSPISGPEGWDQAELVALRVGEDDPGGVGRLADVGAGGAEGDEAFGLGLLVVGAQVQVQAVLHALGLGDR